MVIQYTYKMYVTLNNSTALKEHFTDKDQESHKSFLLICRSDQKPPIANESC